MVVDGEERLAIIAVAGGQSHPQLVGRRPRHLRVLLQVEEDRAPPPESNDGKMRYTDLITSMGSTPLYSVEKKNQVKFSDTCSVMADGLCTGCPRLVGRRKAANSNRLEFFCTKLYIQGDHSGQLQPPID